jgi:hypothetical protein
VRQARAHHRHELHTLTYVTLDQANGGIVRNLSRDGMGAQVVAAVRPHQQLRVRFELRYPRLRVETRGEVTWATFSGQCGIRFLDLSPRMAQQIDEWIFGNLLDGAALHEGAALHSEENRSIFTEAGFAKAGFVEARSGETRRGDPSGHSSRDHASREQAPREDDGLMISAAPVNVIELPSRAETVIAHAEVALPEDEIIDAELAGNKETDAKTPSELDWLSRPLSSRGLAWTVNSLAVTVGVLLFALVFLLVVRELPRWPLALVTGIATFVGASYWGFFKLFGGTSAGVRLARLAGYEEEEEEVGARFR